MRVDGGKRFRRTNRKKEGTHMTAIIVAGILAVTAVRNVQIERKEYSP